MKAQDYPQLRDGYWNSKKEQWDTEQHSDEHENWRGGDDVKDVSRQDNSFDNGYLEAGCEISLIRFDHLKRQHYDDLTKTPQCNSIEPVLFLFAFIQLMKSVCHWSETRATTRCTSRKCAVLAVCRKQLKRVRVDLS